MTEHTSRKKNTLLARKQSLLNEIKYYEVKVAEARSEFTNNNFIHDDSSDSEQEFTVDIGPSITELKLKQKLLKTCLQATQELTSLAILQSEVNILVHDPVLNKEAPVKEEGVWREVTAECRIDLVPFSINFYVHKPTRMFAPTSYRSLQVTPVKSSHEVELSRSVLPSVTRPSDAIEMIRNYSAAHRSRRTTLARLAEKYSGTLFMEPMPEGGYILKCAGLMEVQWTLQNKWSALAPFHHRMVFDLEFMDESYIKVISQLHKEIIDPTLETDERTLLLAKIINTCLEAKSTTQHQNESTDSEPETAEKLRSRCTTLDQEPEAPERNKRKDSEVMAPPKTIPKKSKPKGKENIVGNKVKAVKRTADVKETENSKKTKTDDSKNSEVKTSSKSKLEKGNKDKALQTDVKLNDVQQKENIAAIAAENSKKNLKNAAKKDKKTHTDKLKNQQKIKDKPSKINENNHDKETEKVPHSKDAIAKTNDNLNTNRVKETKGINKELNKKTQNKKESNLDNNKKKKTLPVNNIPGSKQNRMTLTEQNQTTKRQKPKSNDINRPKSLEIKNDSKKVSKGNIKGPKLKENNKQEVKELKKSEKNQEANENINKDKVILSNKAKTNKMHNKDKDRNLLKKIPNLAKEHKEIKKPSTINYIKNQFLPKKSQVPNKALATKIPRISPRKLSNLKPAVQDISKSSKSSVKSLQKATNIPRLLKKPQSQAKSIK